jgi:hypothetical protein
MSLPSKLMLSDMGKKKPDHIGRPGIWHNQAVPGIRGGLGSGV